MNKDVKQKWVDALRSGKYEQGRFLLKNNDGQYCCLGVLCDLAVQEGVARETAESDEFYYDGDALTPPPSVKEWAGSNLEYLDIGGEGEFEFYAELNDYDDLTFDQIADLIEVFA